MKSIHQIAAEFEHSGIRAALCTIIETKGSTPRKPGAKMIVKEDGFLYGTIGGGALEMQVVKDALDVIQSKKSRIFEHALVHDHGMCCGGVVRIFIEPIMTKKKLFIFGAGHIGKALSYFASQLDFRVTLIDERENVFVGWNTEQIICVNKKHKIAFKDLEFDKNTFVCVITHNHAYDREIVQYCVKKSHSYLGMIGSKRKVEIAKKIFLTGKLLSDKEIKNIDWPMGIQIKTNTPEEIAIAILAKLIDVRTTMES